MHDNALILNLSVPQALAGCVIGLGAISIFVWGAAHQRTTEEFRVSRVIGLTLLCLSTSLPFACFAYLWRPWDFDSLQLQADIALMVYAPIITAFILGYARKRKIKRK